MSVYFFLSFVPNPQHMIRHDHRGARRQPQNNDQQRQPHVLSLARVAALKRTPFWAVTAGSLLLAWVVGFGIADYFDSFDGKRVYPWTRVKE